MEINILILAVIVILIPILFIIGSMCSYVGKVWAMRILFRKKGEDKNGEEER